jgi:hypothetical protein
MCLTMLCASDGGGQAPNGAGHGHRHLRRLCILMPLSLPVCVVPILKSFPVQLPPDTHTHINTHTYTHNTIQVRGRPAPLQARPHPQGHQPRHRTQHGPQDGHHDGAPHGGERARPGHADGEERVPHLALRHQRAYVNVSGPTIVATQTDLNAGYSKCAPCAARRSTTCRPPTTRRAPPPLPWCRPTSPRWRTDGVLLISGASFHALVFHLTERV